LSDHRIRALSVVHVIGIDLGGTAIKAGCFTPQGECLQWLNVATPQPSTPDRVLTALCDLITQLDPHHQAAAIGVGIPGPTDHAGRIAKISINLDGWDHVPLADWIEGQTQRPTILANDANCAGLGEAWLGAGRGFMNFILLTLGTGVGGAIFLNGSLFTGSHDAAGELGLITFIPDGHPCRSGNQGSLEQYLSIQGIRRRTGLDPQILGQQAQSGNPSALAFWDAYGRDLGGGLASLIYILTPDAIVIGGGICASAEFFIPSTWAEIERRVLAPSREGLVIVPAQLGNLAGMTGAAQLALKTLGVHAS
jgi:glucokinase